MKSLPPISRVARRLISVTNGGDVDIRELASLISKDQAMTARILRVANSSFYGLPRRVETLSKAVVILGMHTVRSIALRAAMLGMQPSGGALQTPVEALWKHSMAVASAAQLLAKRLKLPDPEVAFVAGLLHDLGKVVLMEVLSERYLRLLEHSDVATAPLHIREQSAFGITHMEAGHAL
ncbi:MAG: HDOD domain-containing protein, partial [Rhodothermales bacterium]